MLTVAVATDWALGWEPEASRATSSSEKEISASCEVLFLLTEVVFLLVAEPELGSEVTEGSPVLVRLGATKVPEQTCFTMQLLCIIREQVSLGQGRQPALSFEVQWGQGPPMIEPPLSVSLALGMTSRAARLRIASWNLSILTLFNLASALK